MIARFAAREDDAVDVRHFADDERRGQFDDAAHAAGAEVVVEDDEFQGTEFCTTKGTKGTKVFGPALRVLRALRGSNLVTAPTRNA